MADDFDAEIAAYRAATEKMQAAISERAAVVGGARPVTAATNGTKAESWTAWAKRWGTHAAVASTFASAGYVAKQTPTPVQQPDPVPAVAKVEPKPLPSLPRQPVDDQPIEKSITKVRVLQRGFGYTFPMPADVAQVVLTRQPNPVVVSLAAAVAARVDAKAKLRIPDTVAEGAYRLIYLGYEGNVVNEEAVEVK